MFTALSQVSGVGTPLFETRKALVIINLQNDSLYVKDDLYITKNRDFVPRLKEMIPYFRKYGDIVWVVTHMGAIAAPPSPDAARVEEKATRQAEKNREERKREEKQIQDDTFSLSNGDKADYAVESDTQLARDLSKFYPSSRIKDFMHNSSAAARAQKRSADLQTWYDNNNVIQEVFSKPRKGSQARFYIAGTKGAEICDELLDVVDESVDLILPKLHYSAFDQTSLLMALRTRLVTEVYLCGCLTNVGIYSTAADAVQHGLQVTLVEDCLGYRNEEKHDEAMRQMADIMGVSGIDSEEIIEEAGGRPVPDAETPGITLAELSIANEQAATVRDALNQGLIESQQKATVSFPNDGGSPILPPRDTSGPTSPFPPMPEEPGYADRVAFRDELKATPSPGPSTGRSRSSWNISRSRTLGPNDRIGSGDSRIIYNLLGAHSISIAFARLREEVAWQTMVHRSGQVPRLVAVQGEIGENGDIPIYRHPADESPPLMPFTAMVDKIRQEIESLLSQSFNHALIQLYRDGIDNISEHSDKTLDIVRGSSVVNVSIGAQRVMTLRTKRSKSSQGTDSPSLRQTQRIKMPNNSVFVLGPQTNREWLHGIRSDKRPGHEKTEEEKAFGGERISITFRQIGTFMNPKQKIIWGAGATKKVKAEANRISTRDHAQMEAMIDAFGKENQNADFDWNLGYGSGFDVVNLTSEQPKLILCKDSIANIRVQLALYEKTVSFTIVQQETPNESEPDRVNVRYNLWRHGLSNSEVPVFQDPAVDDSEEGDFTIMMYLEKHHSISLLKEDATTQHEKENSRIYLGLKESNELLFIWRQVQDSQLDEGSQPTTNRFKLEKTTSTDPAPFEEFYKTLMDWERYATADDYIGGNSWTVIDCAFWPVLNEIMEWKDLNKKRCPHLVAYHHRVLERDSVKKVFEHEK